VEIAHQLPLRYRPHPPGATRIQLRHAAPSERAAGESCIPPLPVLPVVSVPRVDAASARWHPEDGSVCFLSGSD